MLQGLSALAYRDCQYFERLLNPLLNLIDSSRQKSGTKRLKLRASESARILTLCAEDGCKYLVASRKGVERGEFCWPRSFLWPRKCEFLL